MNLATESVHSVTLGCVFRFLRNTLLSSVLVSWAYLFELPIELNDMSRTFRVVFR